MKLCTGLVKDSNGWDLVVLSQYDRLRKIGLTKLLKSAMQFGKKVGLDYIDSVREFFFLYKSLLG